MEHLQSIQQIFQDKLFVIPDYQRGYAWEESQWRDMIEDIELLEEGQEHYTGTLVIHPKKTDEKIVDDEGSLYTVYNVVDGQQRLTTITILMIVLSEEIARFGEKPTLLSKGIRKKYIAASRNDDPMPKLTLNKDTNDFYKKNILSNRPSMVAPKLKSSQRLLGAYQFFKSYFENKSSELDSAYFNWLENLYEKLSSKIKLVVYEVPKETEVGVIFEAMNNRGKPLTEMEKAKNYLLYLSSKLTCEGSEELGREINETWSYIFESLMSSGASSSEHENQLLRANWIMAEDYNPKNWNGSNSIKDKYSLKKYQSRHLELRNDIRTYVRRLKDSCTTYCDIVDPNRSNAFNELLSRDSLREKIIEMTEKLLRIGAVSSFIPLLMALRFKNTDNYESYFNCLELCEKFAFRVYRYAEKRANTGQTALFKNGYNIFHDVINAQECQRNIKSLLLYYSPNEKFYTLTEQLGDNWYHWNGIKYLLYEYELHLAKNKPLKLEWMYLKNKEKKDTIEHILPQTPSKDYWTQRWSESEIKEALNDIGNLTLTLDNSVYSNKGFYEKKGNIDIDRSYTNSVIFMEREVSKYAEWTYQEYLDRRRKIENWIKERWYVEEPEDLEIDIDELSVALSSN